MKLRKPWARRRVFSMSRLMASVPPLETPLVSKPSEHLLVPLAQRAAEAGDLGDRARGERGDDLLGDLAASVALRLVGRPGDGDLPVGVARLQAGVEPGGLLVSEVFVSVRSQPADLVERIIAQPTVAELLLLDAAPDFVDDLRSEPDDVEGIQHGDGVGQLFADRVRMAAERVQRGVFDRVERPDGLLGEPAGSVGRASRYRPSRSGRAPRRAAGRANGRARRGSDRPSPSRPVRLGGSGRAAKYARPLPGCAPRPTDPAARSAASAAVLNARHSVCQPTRKCRANAETVVSSCARASTAHCTAREVSTARGAMTSCCLDQLCCGQSV